ncbi:MAG: SLC13 family permease [Xanthomonadales bacterium]|nr:SLC13 family permease [Xanthomonadales bacterium]
MDALGFADLGPQAWLTILVIAGTFVCLVREWFAPDVVLLVAVTVLLAGGVLTPAEALAGFSNPAVLTVAVLFVVAGALRSTGAVHWVGSWVLGRPRRAWLGRARLVGISASFSAFINNTPLVAMLIVAVEDWCRRARVPASRLLIPLSYATILGGMCTLIGTSTNLVVLGLMQEHPDLPPLRMFDPAWVGVPATLVGLAYLMFASRWLLPDRGTPAEQEPPSTEYLLDMRVVDPSAAGSGMAAAGGGHLPSARLVKVQREGEDFTGRSRDELLGGDRLLFAGSAAGLHDVRRLPGLAVADSTLPVSASAVHMVEVVLSRLSPLAGYSVREGHFRQRHGATVLAVNRHGEALHGPPGDIVLRAGDTLLLEAAPACVETLGQSREFTAISLLDDTPRVEPRKAAVALGILGAMILANAVLQVDIFVSALLATIALLATGCIRWRDARRTVDFPLILVIACAFAIGAALAKTGVAGAIAAGLLQLSAGDPFWTLVLIYALTVVFTELLTNNATAVLMFPIGLAAAEQLGVSPMPFIIAVMNAASASFITPIGYQTNMMVYGPGGYRFTDFFRVGTPLTLLVGLVVLTVIPLVWPF